ncbi:hypothetical protein BG000_000490 [Podila horticola]|nr:hypothetical protein BG000_000490 [Podila horticola]
MVKFSLLSLFVATVVTVASAAPYFGQHHFSQKLGALSDSLVVRQCIPETNIQEYHPFQLLSIDLRTYLSKHINSNLLVGGFLGGNKYFQQLEFCIVSTDEECSIAIPSDCIYQGVEYRFRVYGPVQGYLQIEDEQLRIVPDFEDASSLSLFRGKDGGLRIDHQSPDGSRSVLQTGAAGRAVILNKYEQYNGRQYFEIMELTNFNKKAECHSSKSSRSALLKAHTPEAMWPMTSASSKTQVYYIRVNAPVKDYLRDKGDVLKIVDGPDQDSKLT